MFLKYIHRNNVSIPGAAGHARGPEQQVKGQSREACPITDTVCCVKDKGCGNTDVLCGSPLFLAILNELLQRENRVLHFWTLKKKRLDQCQQYVVFERSAKQVWPKPTER